VSRHSHLKLFYGQPVAQDMGKAAIGFAGRESNGIQVFYKFLIFHILMIYEITS
jgi:hypothetical protein